MYDPTTSHYGTMVRNIGPVDVIYLDFRKAFDTVPHRRLLKKLEAYGIKGDLLTWIENFLSGRRQRVSVNGKLSTWAEILSASPKAVC